MPKQKKENSEILPKRVPRRVIVRKSTNARSIKNKSKLEEVDIDADKSKKIQLKTEEEKLERKAPTSINEIKKTSTFFSKNMIVVSFIIIFGLITTILIGTSDKGQIDVSAKIIKQNNQIVNGEIDGNNNEKNSNQIIPVQNTSGLPNGGLSGRKVGTPPIETSKIIDDDKASSTATTTASTTPFIDEETATSSEAKKLEENNLVEENLSESEGEVGQ